MSDSAGVRSLAVQYRILAADRQLSETARRLATGLRINRGADDPAALIASEALRADLASLVAESRALARQEAVANVADGALQGVSGLLSESRALAVANASTAGMSDEEIEANRMEMESAIQAADRVAAMTFDGQRVLDGSVTLSAGGDARSIDEFVPSRAAGPVGVEGARSPGDLHAAARSVGDILGRIGSFQRSAIDSHSRAVEIRREQMASAESSIRDADWAAEASGYVRSESMKRVAIGALALANSTPEDVLGLLGRAGRSLELVQNNGNGYASRRL